MLMGEHIEIEALGYLEAKMNTDILRLLADTASRWLEHARKRMRP
jgi:hypothetical protein